MFEISRSALVLFGFELHWYGLLIALGVLAAVLLIKNWRQAWDLRKGFKV